MIKRIVVGRSALSIALASALTVAAAPGVWLVQRADSSASGASEVEAALDTGVLEDPFVYVVEEGDESDVSLHYPHSGETIEIAGLDGVPEYSPSLSPDGSMVAFARSEGDADIYVVNADGSNLRRITSGPATDGGPNWSPDGKRIAFWRENGDGHPNIHIAAIDGQEERQLTSNDYVDVHPAWSPSSDAIAFVRNAEGRDVYTVDVSSGQETQTTRGEELAQPTWSPDGSQIVAAKATSEQDQQGTRYFDLVRIRVADGEIATLQERIGKEVTSVAWRREGVVVTAATEDLSGFKSVVVEPQDGRIAGSLDLRGEPQ